MVKIPPNTTYVFRLNYELCKFSTSHLILKASMQFSILYKNDHEVRNKGFSNLKIYMYASITPSIKDFCLFF